MNSFTNGARVTVKVDYSGIALNAAGTVKRLCTNGAAWIALDRRSKQESVHAFPADDAGGRGTHVKAYPNDCEPEQKTGKQKRKQKRTALRAEANPRPVPTPATFGRDHWTTLLYIETCCTDADGTPDKRRMRCDAERHPFLNGNHGAEGFEPTKRYPTWLRDGVLLSGHDDWDCAADLVAAGYLESVGTGANPQFEMTDAGNLMVMRLRSWKQRGYAVAAFTLDEAVAS